ncbi:hypothetical protein BCCGELA001_08060 [Bradyrhizobium sp. CCGE-LA001]|nr:hypothetical protein BCCGELA001_08060 [Bradyrhizobium sp. CCGE-LA001]
MFRGAVEKARCWRGGESLVGRLLKRAAITAHGELDADIDIVVLTEACIFDDRHSDTRVSVDPYQELAPGFRCIPWKRHIGA